MAETRETCDAQYGKNPDLCHQPPGHDGPHSNKWGTTWARPEQWIERAKR